MNRASKCMLVEALLGGIVLTAAPVWGQAPPPEAPPPAAAPAAAPAEPAATAFSPEQLEQMVSPIALYPDALAMQILMASTYPLEVVEADRWLKKYPNLKTEELDKAVADKKWDPSVKSLVHFPTILSRMSDNLDWTRDMGDAFLAQQKEVLDAIQRMRQKAYELGNLKSTPEQKVTVEPAQPPAGSQTVVVQQAPPQVIKIEPAQPEVVYVPTYNPAAIYGPPPPTMYYPSMYAYPPGYVATASLLSFGAGMAVGAALWSDCDWHHGDVNVDYNTNINRNVNNSNVNRNNVNRGQRPQQWQHNPQHRQGVNYRNDAMAKKYGGQGAGGARRDSARGYQRPSGAQPRQASTGSTRLGAGSTRPSGSVGRGGQPSVANRAAMDRPASSSRPAAQSRPGAQNTAFGSMDNGRAERAASARGASSRGVDRGSFGRDSGGFGGRGGSGGYSGRSGGGFGGRGGGGGGAGGRGGGRGRR